jgi:hypothetical protein
MEYYVYEWFILETGEIFHIGKGKYRRMFDKKNNRNKYFKNIVSKYECDVRIFKDNLTEEEAWKIEKERIAELRPRTNFHVGGSGGDTWSNLPKHEKERIAEQVSNSLKGNSCAKGKKWSKESREKLSQSQRGKVFTKETLDKLKKAKLRQFIIRNRQTGEEVIVIGYNGVGEFFGKPRSTVRHWITSNNHKEYEFIKN